MKQVRKQLLTGLRYGAILAVLLLGLVSIIGTGSSSSDAPPAPTVQEGVFMASAVEGLYYSSSPSGRSGYTDGTGTFQYVEGDTVAFFFGGPAGAEMGSALGAAVLGPNDIVGDDDEARWITLVLYALDEDNDPTNGVTLPGGNFPGDMEGYEVALESFLDAMDNPESVGSFFDGIDAFRASFGWAPAPRIDAVATTSGDFLGYEVPGRMKVWKGIPFAVPPVGDLRFAPPVEYIADEGGEVLLATQFGDMCVQDDGRGSEDCLFLNVFAPSDAANLPVMVWIHGGAFIQGSACNPGYDMPDLVHEDVVVVTVNYRLNAFGFLPHPALEDPTGNFGLKDQVAALQWIQANIEGFGGDPGNVTIFGESAGGHSVLSLMASQAKDAGLFQKAIVQSGSYSPDQTGLATGYYTLGSFFGDLNDLPDVVPGLPPTGTGPCSGTNDEIRACMRALPADTVVDIQRAAPTWAWFTPVYHAGTFLPQSIEDALGSGEIADVPVMIGSNLHEGTLFAAMFLPDFSLMHTEDDYYGGVRALLNPTDSPGGDAFADVVADYYLTVAPGTDNLYRNAYSMIWTDATFNANNMVQWGDLAAAGVPTYAYWFVDEDAPINPTYGGLSALSPLLDFGAHGLGASHSFEIQYIFGSLHDHPDATADQKSLSDRMIAYWANFAKDGEPAGESWPGINLMGCITGASDECIMALHPDEDSMVGFGPFFEAHNLEFWMSLED